MGCFTQRNAWHIISTLERRVLIVVHFICCFQVEQASGGHTDENFLTFKKGAFISSYYL